MHSNALSGWRLWLFGPGADAITQLAMADCAADVLILDLEDFTPAGLRHQARAQLGDTLARWREANKRVCVRINALDAEGPEDLAAAMPHAPDVIAYPMARHGEDMRRLDASVHDWEARLGLPGGSTQLMPVCETAQGILAVREMAAASPRVRYALMGTEDLAADLLAERSESGLELAHARSHFLLLCRACGIEPIDAPYTWASPEGAAAETRASRQLGYRCKSLVRPEHAYPILQALRPSQSELDALARVVAGFEAARDRGEDRALVDGLWIEVPTYKAALRRWNEWRE